MGYFGDLLDGIRTTAQGLRLTGTYLYKNLRPGGKPFALEYPDERLPIDKVTHRGLHEYDVDRCISCELCAKACPVDCIYIESVGKGKTAIMTRFDIDYSKCLFCALCVPPCPSECIVLGERYSLPGHSRDDMVVRFHEGGYPIQVRSEHAETMMEEFRRDELFEKKRREREEHGIRTLVPQDPGGRTSGGKTEG
jgi:NADH-quinone oxidoreductase subunit I